MPDNRLPPWLSAGGGVLPQMPSTAPQGPYPNEPGDFLGRGQAAPPGFGGLPPWLSGGSLPSLPNGPPGLSGGMPPGLGGGLPPGLAGGSLPQMPSAPPRGPYQNLPGEPGNFLAAAGRGATGAGPQNAIAQALMQSGGGGQPAVPSAPPRLRIGRQMYPR
jgi:hypothetical protein